MDTVDLLSLESRSARVAAMLDVRPTLGFLWRRCLSISEAAASLSIEDVGVRETTIAGMEADLDPDFDDPQAIAVARSIHRLLVQPRNLLSDPAETLRSAIKASRMSSLVDPEHGGRAAWVGQENPESWEEATYEFSAIVPDIIKYRGPVVSRCIAVAQALADILPERLPIAERLMFVSAEHTIRIREYELDRMDRRQSINPTFVLTPSLALFRSGLRSWSPQSPAGRNHLVTRLGVALGIEIGRLAEIRAWDEKREAFADLWRSGTTSKLADLLSRRAVISADLVMQECEVTPRTARSLISAAEDHGLLRLVVRRRSFRIWAVPALASMIADSGNSRLDFAKNPARKLPSDPEQDAKFPTSVEDRPDFSEALKAMDQAMAKADRHLSRYHEKVARRESRAKDLDEE